MIGDGLFYDWELYGKNWIIGRDEAKEMFPYFPAQNTDSLAVYIIEEIFDLRTISNRGTDLPGYDINNKDAYQMIQLSLAAELATSDDFLECYATEDGSINFYSIGKSGSSIWSHILYNITTGGLTQKCENVIISGYDPPPIKFVREGYNIFDFFNMYGDTGESTVSEHLRDDDKGSYPFYWLWSEHFGPQACEYKKEGYIEYGNPHFNDDNYLRDVIYYPNDFEQIIGTLYKIHVPWFKQGSSRIEFREHTPRYIELDGMGKLQKKNWKSGKLYTSTYCLEDADLDADVGIVLPNSDSNKFIGVTAVHIYGYRLNQIEVDEIALENDKTTKGPADFIVALDSMCYEPFQLSEGQDYMVVQDMFDLTKMRIVFLSSINPNYADKYGGVTGAGGELSASTIRISSNFIYQMGATTIEELKAACPISNYFTLELCEGVLRDGETHANNQELHKVFIFPTGDGSSGYAIPVTDGRIVVTYEWDNPCVACFDLENRIDRSALESIEITFFPMIMQDTPQYIAHNGEALDVSQQLVDIDPTTEQNLGATEYAQIMNNLQNGDIQLTLPFLDQNGCDEMSERILELQNDGVTETTVYVCDPEATPSLGETIDGKVINSIDYSYQDGSQYFISVHAGPLWQGSGGWSNSVYKNTTESLQTEGVVRQVYPDNIKCIVNIERIGLLECLNGQRAPLEVGDKVSVTIYNNPVSV